MFKVKVITVGKCKEEWLSEALLEYEKRMQKMLKIEWVLLKNDAQLESYAQKEPDYICLDLKGKLLSSEEFSQKLLQLLEQGGSRLSILIGGAEGFSENVLSKAKFLISLSHLTFTHQLVRLILVEQIYRALEIAKGTEYHK